MFHCCPVLSAFPDEHVMPLDPRWNMQFLEIIRNSMNFDTEMEHTDQLLMLLKSAANRWVTKNPCKECPVSVTSAE